MPWQRLLIDLRRAFHALWLGAGGATVCLALLATDGCWHKSSLDRIERRGALIVATRNGPTSYYIGPRGEPKGFEYELVSRFAQRLGVELKLKVVDEVSELLPLVLSGQADLAAAGLTVTPMRKQRVAFGPAYQQINEQVVYRAGTPRPHDVEDLIGGELQVIAGSSYEEHLQTLRGEYPNLDWKAVPSGSIEPLMQKVVNGEIEYTIADSTMVAVHRRYFPRIQPAFTLGETQSLAWAFAPGDDTLRRAAQAFFQDLSQSGRLAALRERHYGHLEDFDFVGVHTFLKHAERRLPGLRPVFEEAARRSGLDWRLLAAMGYQESHWNPDAISPTGVRGIMMLTRRTARQLGVENRSNPRASVLGGARYFKRMKQRLPERIPEPDRTWLALAAYNIGMGHLEDARVITDIKDQNPDKWLQVKDNLPLLTQKEWYSRVEYGYARGYEPVQYVENIRSYYDILVWLTSQETPILQASANTKSEVSD